MLRSEMSMLLAMSSLSTPALGGEELAGEARNEVERQHDDDQDQRGSPGHALEDLGVASGLRVAGVDEHRQARHLPADQVEVHRVGAAADDQQRRGLPDD